MDTGEEAMVPGGHDVIVRHGLSTGGARSLVRAYFSKLWPNCIVEDDDGELFIHEDESVKERIDREGVVDERGFTHVISLDGELTAVVEPGKFAARCERDLAMILGSNLGF